MNCIILDDEPHAIEVLERYVQQTPSLQLVASFRNPIKALDFLQSNKIDLVFLDVNMPNLSGMQFLQALNHQPMIIFTTAYSSYAAESYEWNAVDYLVKPIVFERFLKAVNKANDKLGDGRETKSVVETTNESDHLLLKSGTQIHRVKSSEILFISKESNYLEVNLNDKKILIRSNMSDIFSWLPKEKFCRVHKSYVVALDQVDIFESNKIKIGTHTIPIGASYREEFLERAGQ